MKKTILLMSIVSSIVTMSNTIKGEVSTTFKNTNSFKINDANKVSKKEFKIDETTTDGHIVLPSGLTLGAKIQAKDIVLPKDAKVGEKFLKDSTLYGKYEKDNLNVLGEIKRAEGSLEVSGVNTSWTKGVDYIAKGKLTVPFSKDKNIDYLDTLKLNTVLGVRNKYVDANVEVENNFSKVRYEKDKLKHHTLEFVKGEVNAKYDITQDTKLYSAAKMLYGLNKDSIEYKDQLRDKDTKLSESPVDSKFYQEYSLGVETKPIQNTKLNSDIFVQNVTNKDVLINTNKHTSYRKDNLVAFGTKLGVEYKGLKNTTLSVKGTLGGEYRNDKVYMDSKFSSTNFDKTKYLQGYVSAEFNAKYNINKIDKVTITPEMTVKASADQLPLIKKYDKGLPTNKLYSFTLEPKAIVKYNPLSRLEINTNVSTPIDFTNKDKQDNKIKFSSVDVKTGLDIKYTW